MKKKLAKIALKGFYESLHCKCVLASVVRFSWIFGSYELLQGMPRRLFDKRASPTDECLRIAVVVETH